MKLRFALFLAAATTVGVIAASCAPKNDNGGGGTFSPTPTQSASGTPTPAPGVTPGIKPIDSWVTPDGKELWLGFEMTGAIQSITSISTYATNCTNLLPGLGITGTSGAFHTVRFRNAAPPDMNCTPASHYYSFFFKTGDGGCTDGCVDTNQPLTFPAVSGFGGQSLPAFSTVDVYDDPNVPPTAPGLIMKALNSSSPPIVFSVSEERIYDAAGNFIAECDVPFTSGPSTIPALVEVCPATPVGVTPGAYNMLFGGTVNGNEAFEYIPFTYHPGFPP